MSSGAASTKAKVDEYAKTLKEEEQQLGNVKEKADDARMSTQELKDTTDKASKSSKGFADKLDDVSSGARGIPGPIGDAINGVNGLTKATLRFIATPLGATLAAISALLAMVTSWFKRTEEGQNALAVGSAYFTQVLNSLLDVADNVGEWLYKAFTKPKDALNDLVEFLKGQVINRINSIGMMAQGIWKMLNGDFSDGFKQFSNGYMQGITGVQNIAGKVSSWMGDTNKKAEERMQITRRQNKLDEDERKNLVERAKLEKQISELREKSVDRSIPEKERSKAVKEAAQLTKQMYDEELRLANERYEIIRDTNKLSHSNKEDKKAEAEAEAELYRVQSQRADALRGLAREQNRVDSSASSASKHAADERAKRIKDEQKYLLLLEQWKRERERAARDLQLSTAQAEIDAMEDGTKKTLAQVRLDFEKRETEIKRAYDDLKQAKIEKARQLWEADPANKGKTFNAGSVDVSYSAAETENYNKQLNANLAERIRREKETQENLIASYQSYTDRKIAIDKEYNRSVEEINAAIEEAQKKGETRQVEALTRSLGEAAKKRIKELSDIAMKELQESPLYSLAWKDLGTVSTETLNMLIAKFKEFEGQFSADPEAMKEWTDKIKAMSDEVVSRNPFKAMAEAQKELEDARKKQSGLKSRIADIQEEINSLEELIEIDEKTGSSNATTAKNKELLIQKEKELKEATDEYGESVVQEAGAQDKLKKSWSEVKSEVDTLANAIISLGNEIGGEAGQIMGIIGNVMTFTTDTISGIKAVTATGAASLSTLEKASAILAIIGAAIQLATQIASMFGESEEEKQARLRREEMLAKMTSSVEAYRLEVIKARQEEEKWFANTKIRDLADQWELSSAAQKAYFEVARSQTQRMREDLKEWNVTVNDNPLFDKFRQRKDFYDAYYESIMQLGHTFDMEMKNEFDQLETLSSFVKRVYGQELFGSEGMLNTDVIDQLLEDYGDRIQHDDEAILKNLNELSKQYKEWQEKLKEYINNEFGGFSDALVDSLWEWYEKGTDVMGSFRQNARDTFQNVAKDMMKELVNSVVFDRLKERLQSAFTIYSLNTNNGQGVQSALAVLTASLDAILGDFEKTTAQAIPELQEFMTQLGEVYDKYFGSDAVGQASETFDNIRDAWVETVTAMQGDTESLGKTIARIMFESLVNSNVFNAGFDEWLADWIKRYEAALNANPQEKVKRLAQLEEERTQKLAELTEETKMYADAVGYSTEAVDEFSSSLDNLSDTLLDTLLDTEKDAAQTGAEIGKSLVNEMLKEMLAAEKYAKPKENIRQIWKNVLKGGGEWTDEEGLFGEKGVVYTLDKVLELIAQLNNEIANDDDIKKYIDAWNEFDESLKKTEEEVKNVTSSFDGLRDMFMDAILDVENGAENLRKKLRETLAKDLIDKAVFEGFDEWKDEWVADYLAALEAGDEELLEHLIKVLEDREKAMAESVGKYVKDLQEATRDTTFTDMESSIIDSLTNMEGGIENFAEDMKKTIARKIIEGFIVGNRVKEILEDLQKTYDYLMSAPAGMYTPEQIANYMANGIYDKNGDLLYAGYETYGQEISDLQAMINVFLESVGLGGQKAQEVLGDLESSFVSTLLDMESDAETFGKKIGMTLIEEMLTKMMNEKYAEKMAEIRELYRKALAGEDGVTIEDVLQAIRELNEAVAADNEVQRLTDSYHELEGQIEETEEAVKDLDSTFADMADEWTSTLMDMNKTSADMGKQIGQTLAQKIIREFVVDTMLSSYLQTLDDVWNMLMTAKENGADVTAEGVAFTLSHIIEDAVKVGEEAQPLVDAIIDMLRQLGLWEDEVAESADDMAEEVEYALQDMRSNFVSSLMDMEGDAEEFSNEIGKILAESFIDKFILGDAFDQQMEQWQQQYESIIGSGMSEDERKRQLKQLRDAIAAAKEGYSEEAKAILELFGLDAASSDKSATANMADKATYDQFELYLGIALAQQINGEQQLSVQQEILATLRGMDGITSPDGSTIKEVRGMLRTTNEYLYDIKSSNRNIYDLLVQRMQSIDNKLSKL